MEKIKVLISIYNHLIIIKLKLLIEYVNTKIERKVLLKYIEFIEHIHNISMELSIGQLLY